MHERLSIVLTPLFTIVLYFLFFKLGCFFCAFLAICYLSFVTYGSCCHDLVHANFGFSRKLCDFWLSLIELLMLRSGTTYRFTHLIHHQRYPDFENDPEGRASFYSLIRTLLEGPIFHIRLVVFSLKHAPRKDQKRITLEISLILFLWCDGILLRRSFPALLIYEILVTLGSWLIPLITSYLVHTPHEADILKQTKIFRGWYYRMISLDHLYHLEHHLYPQVPHCRWHALSKILDPYLVPTQTRHVET